MRLLGTIGTALLAQIVVCGYVSASPALADSSKQITRLRLYTLPTSNVRLAGNASLTQSRSGVVQLHRGEVLVESKKATILKADHYLLSLSRGTIALISKDSRSVKLRNLWDRGRGTVRAIIGRRSVDVPLGGEIVLADNSALVRKAVASDGVARRKMYITNLPGGASFLKGEVSTPSLVHRSHLLKQLFKSKARQDRIVFEKLIKTTACLQITTASHGRYFLIRPPKSGDTVATL